MWTCPYCGEVHECQFKDCWKCANPATSPHFTAAPPKPKFVDEPRRLRSTGSIVMRVVVAFVIGLLGGLAILHRDGRQFDDALWISLYIAGGMAFLTGVTFWILFPYVPSTNLEESASDENNETLSPPS